MRVGLFDQQGVRTLFDFDAKTQKWKRQGAGAAHLVGLDSGLPNGPSKLFVKRWDKQAAPAQMLLVQAIKNPLPNTPAVVGQGVDGGDRYYFFANLSDRHKLLDAVVRRAKTPVQLERLLIQENVGLRVCKAAAVFLKAVNDRGYVYPDFTHKNIMIAGASACDFIDLDSCIPVDELAKSKNASGRFALTYWGAWRMVDKSDAPSMLSQTMVLSFAIVWARAAAMLRRNEGVEEVQQTILNPTFPEVQEPFWRAVEARNIGEFCDYFGLADTPEARAELDSWAALLANLKAGREAPWHEITQRSEATLKLGREAQLKAPAQVAPQPGPKPVQPAGTLSTPVPPPANDIEPKLPWGEWLFWALLSPNGRLTRLGFLTAFGIYVASFVLAQVVLTENYELAGTLGWPMALVLSWVWIAVYTKRLHDLGVRGVWFVVANLLMSFFIVFGNEMGWEPTLFGSLAIAYLLAHLLLLGFCLFKRGAPGQNRFGLPKF